MKKVLIICLALVICLISFSACGEQPATQNTVNIEVNSAIELAEYFTDNDSYYNVNLKTPSGERFLFTSRKVVFSEIGTYVLTHANGSVTNIAVKDSIPPDLGLSFAEYNPVAGEQTSLPVVATDNCNGIITDLSVTQNGNETGNVFTVANNTTLIVTVSDKSGNESCLTVNFFEPETKVLFGKGLFNNLNENETYVYSYRITEYSGESSISYVGNGFTVKKNKKYMVDALAKSATETLTATVYYIPMI